MTELQAAGASALVLAYIALGLSLRWVFQHLPQWWTWRGVLLHEALGAVLILGCSAAYHLVFRPAWDGLVTATGLGVVTALVLGIPRAVCEVGDEQPPEWDGLTEKGNLKRHRLWGLENLLSAADEEWEALERLTRARVKVKLMAIALREGHPPRTSGEWEREVDEVLNNGGG